jgi:outer membrane translocation and assembly module TamA
LKRKTVLNKEKITYSPVFISFCLVVIISCSPVKYVPDNSYLLNRVEVNVKDKNVKVDDINSYIKQKENLRILGFAKFHLWLYNLSSKKKSNDWFKRIGEEPVVYNEILTQKTNSQLNQVFKNKGYYNSSVKNNLSVNKKRQKVDLEYIISPGEPYKIRNITYHINDSTLRNIFYTDTTQKSIFTGQLFDVDLLEGERRRISGLFKSRGYYDFNKGHIYYVADSNFYSNQVDIDMHLNKDVYEMKPYLINEFTISLLPGTSFQNTSGQNEVEKIDTLLLGNYKFISGQTFRYNPELFINLNNLKSGQLYNINDVEETFNAFTSLKQFRFINIQFEKIEGGNNNLLNCNINLAPMTKQSVSANIEGTNTSGNFGVAGNLNYQHRNLFQNAEIFRINLRGARERQQSVVKDVSSDFNTSELGVETSLSIPKLLGPGNWLNYFDQFLPRTVFTLGYNFQNRPDYTRTITNFKIGYNWKTTKSLWHNWNIIDFNMVNLYEFDPDFINSIMDLYIKSSFTDHLIFATNYSVVYNTQDINVRKNYKYVKFSIESAGNTLNLLSSVFGAKKVESIDTVGVRTSNYYKIFNTRYAQYVKADLEFRYGYMIDEYNSIVGRAFIGVGLPYGNFDVLPFEKKYFTGGANGIRAWQVRSLGPGTYRAPSDAYPNQSSDIKLEANLEYRYKLIKMLEGAIFLDVGNVWAINDKDNRPGAKFEFGNFYKQLAIGTGTGFRFDFSFFIFRLDLGLKLRDPAQLEGNGWIIGNRKLNNYDFNISFAIGYPF